MYLLLMEIQIQVMFLTKVLNEEVFSASFILDGREFQSLEAVKAKERRVAEVLHEGRDKFNR